MIATLKKLSILTLLALAFSFVAAPTVSAGLFDNSKDEACKGVSLSDSAAPSADCNRSTQSAITRLMRTVINLFSIVIGVVAVVMIIISGLKYITSQGESSAIAGAKNALIYAIVGIIIVAMAQAIVRLVLNKTSLPRCPAGQTQINVPGDCTP